jgi:hypothetical protein
MAYGNRGHIGLVFQNSFGTSVGSNFDYLPFISETLQEKHPELLSEAIQSRFEEGDSYDGINEVGGDIVTEVHPILIGKMLKGWTGQSSSVESNDVFTHTFVPVQDDWDSICSLPPLSCYVYRGTGSGSLYYDLLLNGFTLEIAHGALLKNTWSFVGGRHNKSVVGSPSYVVGSEYTWNQASVTLAGSAITTIKNLTITGNNALKPYGTLDGTKFNSRIVRDGNRMLEISGTMLLDGDTQKDIFIAGTTQNLKIALTGSDVASGDVTTAEQFLIEIPAMKYTDFPDNIGGPGIIEVSFKAKAKYESGSGHAVKFTLVNTKESY